MCSLYTHCINRGNLLTSFLRRTNIKTMARILTKDNKKDVILDKEYVEKLERKAATLDEIVFFLEDKYLGELMEKTEKERNISLSKAKKVLNR